MELHTVRPAWRSPVVLLGFAVVAAVRLATLPASLWEWDEVLFVKGVELFDPVHHRPHPPGYPLLIGLGKLLRFVTGDPFHALVALSVISCLVGYLALVSAFTRMAAGGPPAAVSPPEAAAAERTAVAGALLFQMSPAMLVYGPLALSDPAALMFLSLALAAAVRLPEGGTRAAALLGVFASAAIGCRPQLALAVLPMTAVALVFARAWRPRLAALAAFTLVSLAWFLPLLAAVGGPGGFLAMLGKQAALVVRFDKEMPRTGGTAVWIATRFLAHPWGPRWLALPVLALAAAGFAFLAAGRAGSPGSPGSPGNWRRALPLLVLCGIDLALGLLVMNPYDAVRYALPSMLAVAFAAATGGAALARLARVPAAVYALVALFMAGAAFYTRPLLAARTRTPSPPVQAALWAQRNARWNSVFLVEDSLAAHISYLFDKFQRAPLALGLERYAAERRAPVYLVGDGESGWPGAVTFRWPESDAYGKLTRGLYRVVSISPLPPERRYQVVRGVYAYEPTAREAGWRWMDSDAVIRLFPRGARAVAVTLRIHPAVPWPANSVRIAVDGMPVTTLEIPRGEERRAVVPLPPPRQADDQVEVTFQSDRSFVPAAAGGSDDDRRLAAQLVDVEQLGRQES